MKLLSEFKTFVLRGNVVELAVGIMLGAAFGSIVTSAVNDVLMPPIASVTGGIDFSDVAVDLPGTTKNEKGEVVPVRLRYGKFIQVCTHFLIIGLCLFFVVKGMNALQRKREEAPPDPTASERLLAEIRDLLKKDS